MGSKKDIVYLPIRSLGDFIISASIIKDFIDEKVPISMPEYISDIYSAINGDNLFVIVDSISLKNQPTFFELYKIKNKKSIVKLFEDIVHVFNSLKRKWMYLLDFRSRRLFFYNAKFKWPADGINIYEAKRNLFAANYTVKHDNGNIEISIHKKISRIIIFPDSRIKDKEIPEDLIDQIKYRFPGFEINTANFSTKKFSNNLNYSNFTELINLIRSADLIISSDSLPYHLANFYKIPHFVIYMKTSKFYTEHFKTPFMISNNYFSLTDGTDFENSLNRLNEILI